MKNKLGEITILTLAFLVLPSFAFAAETALAAVAIPQQFYGTVSFQNAVAPDGVKIEAKIDGKTVMSVLTKNGKYGYKPSLFLISDSNGVYADKIVEFYGSGIKAEQTAVFRNGAFTNLNLIISGSIGSVVKGENEIISGAETFVKPSMPVVVNMGNKLTLIITSTSEATSTLRNIQKLGDTFYSGDTAVISGNNVLNGYEINVSGAGISLNAVLAYSDSSIDEDSIKPYRFDSSRWVAITPFTVDKIANTVSFAIQSAATPYVIFGKNTPAPAPTPVVSSGGGGGGGGIFTSFLNPLFTKGKSGDANSDGKIDLLDFNLLMVNWGKTGANQADLNSDGKVDILDFNQIMVNWGK